MSESWKISRMEDSWDKNNILIALANYNDFWGSFSLSFYSSWWHIRKCRSTVAISFKLLSVRFIHANSHVTPTSGNFVKNISYYYRIRKFRQMYSRIISRSGNLVKRIASELELKSLRNRILKSRFHSNYRAEASKGRETKRARICFSRLKPRRWK